MINITRYVWGEHGMYKDTCGYYVDAKEYDRLTAQLTEAKESIGKQVEAKDKACAVLMNQLADRDVEIAKLFFKWQTIDAGNIEQIKHLKDQRSMLIEENTTLRTKLAECEKEAERLAKEMLIQRANAELFHNSKRIEARKQAAREMLEWLLSNRPLRYTERLNFDRMVAKFKIKFELEG